MKERLKGLFNKFKIIIKPFCSFKVLIIYLPIYFMCTGWTFLGLIPSMPNWYKIAAASWYATLWMPWMPEKLITFPLTIFLYKKIFLNPKRAIKEKDRINIENLERLLEQEKEEFHNFINNIKYKRQERRTNKFLKKQNDRRDY